MTSKLWSANNLSIFCIVKLKWYLKAYFVSFPLLAAKVLNAILRLSSVSRPDLSVIATMNSPKSIVPLLSISAILNILSIKSIASEFVSNLFE